MLAWHLTAYYAALFMEEGVYNDMLLSVDISGGRYLGMYVD